MPNPLIDVVDYDPEWPARAATAIAEVREALADVALEIEHIGSTSVPGLAAKPTIDLMAAVADLEDVRKREDRLARLGYLPHANGMSDRLLYARDDDGHRGLILHVVTLESWPTRNQRLFRDHLREHPEDLARYAELKRGLAATASTVPEYTLAKTDLIQEITDRARAARGLPPVPVWEK